LQKGEDFGTKVMHGLDCLSLSNTMHPQQVS